MNNSAIVPLILYLLIIPAIVGTFIIWFTLLSRKKAKEKEFALKHSITLRNAKEILDKYGLKPVNNSRITHAYDNENFFEDISCEDFVIYYINEYQKDVLNAVNSAIKNYNYLSFYNKELKELKKEFGNYDADIKNFKLRRLIKFEKQYFNKLFCCEFSTDFRIFVYIELTYINGRHRCSKHRNFELDEIRNYVRRLNEKRGNFYLDKSIWDSLCRVERGRVTNRLRFAIYERDHYRCRKCGKRGNGNDLEIDHIIPISKGGKSVYANLQTLCHRCNYLKGDNIE